MIRLICSVLTVFAIVLMIASCDQFPEGNSTNLNIDVSTDSISFDTIVSVFGTCTKNFRIVNRNRQAVIITDIKLGSGTNTYYKMNVDGAPCQFISNYELKGNDSIYVFVEAKLPRFDVDSACFILDSVIVSTQASSKSVKLLAWSQDVILKSGICKANEIWDSNRPYLIMDSLEVDYDETLTIEKGVSVLFHKDARMKITGNLKVKGTKDEPVFFQGDRFDVTQDRKEYEHEPGQWGGLEFHPLSKKSEINYAVIKNGLYGIMVLGAIDYAGMPEIEISNTIIKNQSYAGIVSFGAKINCSNSFFSNSYFCILLYSQGNYEFNHITISNSYSYKVRELGSIHLCNYFDYEGVRYVGEFETVNFSNSVIFGSIENEFSVNILEGTSIPVMLDHCLLKLKNEDLLFPYIKYNQLFLNEDPILVKRDTWNSMYPDTLSPLIDKGSIEIANQFPVDYLGNSRLMDGKPDIGAVEFQK